MEVSPNVTTYVAAYRRLKSLEAEITKLKLDIEYVEPIVLAEMESRKIENLPVPGTGAAIVIKRTESVKRKEGSTEEQMCTALRGCGFGDLVKLSYSAASLKKKILTLRGAGQPLPPELAQHVEVTQVKTLEVQVTG